MLIIFAKGNPEKFLFIKSIDLGYSLFNRSQKEVGRIIISPSFKGYYDLRDINFILGHPNITNLDEYEIKQIC